MPPATKPTVYYSPFGGRVLAVAEKGDDQEYERALDQSGVAWKKTSDVAAADLKGKDISRMALRPEHDAAGKATGNLQVEVD